MRNSAPSTDRHWRFAVRMAEGPPRRYRRGGVREGGAIMTPSRMGALIAVFLSGFSHEASGEPPPAGALTLPPPPTSAPALNRAGQAKVELTSVRLDPRDGVAHEPEPVLTDATLRTDERCREGEPARPRATAPEPPKMQQFQ